MDMIFTFLVNLTLTAVAYLCIPLIICFKGRKFTENKIKRIILINGAFVWLIFAIIRAENNIQGSGASVFLWSAVAHWILKAKCVKKEAQPVTSHTSPCANYDIMSEDVLLDPSNSIELEKKHPVTTAPSSSIIPQAKSYLICHKCSSEFDANFAHCPYCGKKVHKKKSKRHFVLIAALIVILICILGCFGYVYMEKARLEEIRENAFTAMYDHKFSKAKFYFDQLPEVENNYPSEYAYVKAGILMDEGQYVEALKKLKELAYPVPETIMDKLNENVYSLGKASYHKKEYSRAQRYFLLIEDYKRSEDYVTLCKANLSYSTNLYNELIRLIGFEDAGEMLVSNALYADKFLEGTWRTQNKSNYFIMYEDGRTSYNIPSSVNNGIYRIVNGVYKQKNSWTEEKDCFSITVIGKDKIQIVSFKNYSVYVLYRQ